MSARLHATEFRTTGGAQHGVTLEQVSLAHPIYTFLAYANRFAIALTAGFAVKLAFNVIAVAQ